MADEEKPKSLFGELLKEAAKVPAPTQPMAVPQLSGIVDMARAKAWFDKHWKEPVICPVCRSGTWTIGAYFSVIHTSTPSNPLAPVWPYVQVACNTCGHTLFFNAVSMGLWSPYTPVTQNG
jgi:hypothetical protein